MKNTKKRFIIFGLLIFAFIIQNFIFLSSSVNADSLWKKQKAMSSSGGEIADVFGENGEPTDLRIVIAKIIQVVLGFLGIIFLILTLLAGYKWMMSRGNADEITTAKAQLMHAVIGLIIILASYSITVFTINALYAANRSSGTYIGG